MGEVGSMACWVTKDGDDPQNTIALPWTGCQSDAGRPAATPLCEASASLP